jgi:hypothetical protein
MSASSVLAAERMTASDWNRFVDRSPEGSVFCRAEFLDALGVSWDAVTVGEGSRRIAAVVLRDAAGIPLPAPFPFTLYHGLLCDEELARSPVHRRVPETLALTAQLIDRLSPDGRISLCLHPSFQDLRSVSWYNYHRPELGQFRIDLRYTGCLDLETLGSFDEFLGSVRSVRRQEFRRASSRFAVETSTDLELLDRLHELTFARQGLARPAHEARLLRSIAEAALSYDFGEVTVARAEDGRPASAALFLRDTKAAYYLVAANDPDFRNAGTSSLLLMDGVRRAFARGLRAVDLVGMNSPNRGDFKASFGAVPTPYLVAHWERP